MTKKSTATEIVKEAKEKIAATKDDDFIEMVSIGRDCVSSLKQKPKVSIGGKEVSLVECDYDQPGVDRFTTVIAKPRPIGYTQPGKYYTVELSEPLDLKWYKVESELFDIYLTNGSELVVSGGMHKEFFYDLSDYSNILNESGEKPKLVLIGSSIEASSLFISDTIILNNTKLVATNTISLINVKSSCVNIQTTSSISISGSILNDIYIQNSKYVDIKASRVGAVVLTGCRTTKLNKVSGQSNTGFSLNLWANDDDAIDLTISNVTLSDYTGVFGPAKRFLTTKSVNGPELETWPINNKIIINRRVDYGTFSGKENIPFIRYGNTDIIVGNELFCASDFFPIGDVSTQPKLAPAVQPMQPYGLNTFQPYQPMCGIYNGSMLWNRAAKVLYPTQFGKTPIGKLGEGLVDTLISQIKSRLGIYVELNNLSEQ